MRSAPLGTPHTASRVRGSGRRRRAGARLLLAGDTTFEDGLGINLLDITRPTIVSSSDDDAAAILLPAIDVVL